MGEFLHAAILNRKPCRSDEKSDLLFCCAILAQIVVPSVENQ